ncbi:MAG: ribbon-helix-helix protein, CopG family [gamma proteobacterium symbiont of Bathyaustriella thionipta]|nr:ribbon-helix-helix protein, CopG family [gamma proteobacterium symbiont of Bathyaustriella thionipta]
MGNQTITIRTESNTVESISSIAKAMDRSRNWVIEDALKQYINQQAWYIEGIQAAQVSLAEGKGIPHEEVMAEISELIHEKISLHEKDR